MTTVAILGATSHIAKGLIVRFLDQGDVRLSLYARSAGGVESFLKANGKQPGGNCVLHEGYGDFSSEDSEVIINCVGVRALGKARVDFTDYFTVTERFDNLVLDHLREKSPEALYIAFSSGAVYGHYFPVPADRDTRLNLAVNALEPEDYYGIARLNAEAKHRAFADLRIVDLRIFSYFSRYIDLNDGYFLADVLGAILKKRVLITDDSDMVRDYLHPDDLYIVVRKCMSLERVNRSLDVRSAAPVTKNELLDYFVAEYGLRYERSPRLANSSATGLKHHYYSIYNSLPEIECLTQRTSMETVREEAKWVLLG